MPVSIDLGVLCVGALLVRSAIWPLILGSSHMAAGLQEMTKDRHYTPVNSTGFTVLRLFESTVQCRSLLAVAPIRIMEPERRPRLPSLPYLKGPCQVPEVMLAVHLTCWAEDFCWGKNRSRNLTLRNSLEAPPKPRRPHGRVLVPRGYSRMGWRTCNFLLILGVFAIRIIGYWGPFWAPYLPKLPFSLEVLNTWMSGLSLVISKGKHCWPEWRQALPHSLASLHLTHGCFYELSYCGCPSSDKCPTIWLPSSDPWYFKTLI